LDVLPSPKFHIVETKVPVPVEVLEKKYEQLLKLYEKSATQGDEVLD
jgi:hypothetical protein